MTNGRTYTKAFKAAMVQRVNEGESKHFLSEHYDIPRTTLINWCRRADTGNHRAQQATIAEIRRTLERYDTGEYSIKKIISLADRSPKVVLEWIEDPSYREATFEFDGSKRYDYYDLTDRSIVTQHLCTQTFSKDERLEFVAALVSPTLPVPA